MEPKIGKPVIVVTEHTYHTSLNMSPGVPYRFRVSLVPRDAIVVSCVLSFMAAFQVRVNVDGWGEWSDPLWYEIGRGIVSGLHILMRLYCSIHSN